MKIIALDDEEMALGSLTDAISEAAPGAELHAFRRAEDALSFIKDTPCDAAFLDVEMAGSAVWNWRSSCGACILS